MQTPKRTQVPTWLLVAFTLLLAPMLIRARQVLPIKSDMCYGCTNGVENWVLVVGFVAFVVLVSFSGKK